MAVTAKHTALTLPVAFALWETVKEGRAGVLRRWALLFTGCTLWIGLLYAPSGGGLDFGGSLARFSAGVQANRIHASLPTPTFLLGRVQWDNPPYYEILAFLLKSTPPFLLLIAAAVFFVLRGRLSLPPWIWLPPVVLFAALLPAPNLGVRYLLPVYPFLTLLAALGFLALWRKGGSPRPWRTLAVALLVWHAATALLNHPRHLSYFNDLVPPKSKSRLLGDSNLDLGQDHRRLARWWRERNLPPPKLAYLGGRDPFLYGLPWEPWRWEDLSGPRPGAVYAVNASFRQLAPALFPWTAPVADSWIQSIPPTNRVGDTWEIWVIPGDATLDQSPYLRTCPGLGYFRVGREGRIIPWEAEQDRSTALRDGRPPEGRRRVRSN